MPPRIPAEWFDGRSGRPQAVEVWLDGEILHFGDQQAPQRSLTWPERQRHGQRQILLPGGGVLAFADGPAFDAWAQASGRREAGVVRWQQSWRLAALSLLLMVVVLAVAYRWGLPWATDVAVEALPLSAERSLGEQLMRRVDAEWLRPSQLSATEQQDWIARWSRALERARRSGQIELPAHHAIHFREGGKPLGPNAFALPGGDIVVTDELVRLLADEPDALLTVLGHELGHVRHRHTLRMVLSAGAVGVVASVVIGDFSSLLAAAPALLASNSYSRDFEREADAYARSLARAGGLDPARMAVFFKRVAEKHPGLGDGSISIAFSSHPGDEERVRFFGGR